MQKIKQISEHSQSPKLCFGDAIWIATTGHSSGDLRTEAAYKHVVTIEGLGKNGDLHPLQKAFMEVNGFQCGFCTPGMILNAYSVLTANVDATDEEIIRGMDENLCRCGAHKRILEAIRIAAREMKGAK